MFQAARCYRVNAVESANAESEQVDLSLMTLEAQYIVRPNDRAFGPFRWSTLLRRFCHFVAVPPRIRFAVGVSRSILIAPHQGDNVATMPRLRQCRLSVGTILSHNAAFDHSFALHDLVRVSAKGHIKRRGPTAVSLASPCFINTIRP